MISLDRVTKQFPDGTVAVDELTLEVPSGGVVALLGSSGSGKTTTLRMINRLIEPTRGSITIDGRDIRDMDLFELRRGIGYVIQQAGLFPHRTIVENVMTVPRLLKWDRKRSRDRAMEMLELVGLDLAMAKRYPSQLSGGQQQRVGVARALASDPPVLLMDEPFGAVDPIVRAQLQQEFLNLQRAVQKTVVFVTHDVDEAITLGTHLAVLRPGGVLAQYGSPAEVLAAPADDFVAEFVGADRAVKLLGLRSASGLAMQPLDATVEGWTLDLEATQWVRDGHRLPVSTVRPSTNARTALDLLLVADVPAIVQLDDEGQPVGITTLGGLRPDGRPAVGRDSPEPSAAAADADADADELDADEVAT